MLPNSNLALVISPDSLVAEMEMNNQVTTLPENLHQLQYSRHMGPLIVE